MQVGGLQCANKRGYNYGQKYTPFLHHFFLFDVISDIFIYNYVQRYINFHILTFIAKTVRGQNLLVEQCVEFVFQALLAGFIDSDHNGHHIKQCIIFSAH